MLAGLRPNNLVSFCFTAGLISCFTLLSGCGGGTGSAQFSLDSSGNLTAARANITALDGTVNTAMLLSSPSGNTITTTSTPPDPAPLGQVAASYAMTFKDEFTTLDTAVWNDHVWYETSNATKNYTVSNGTLKIWPQRDATGKFFNRTLDTDGKFLQTYGYYEVNAKLTTGKGTWPAFWLFNHIGNRRPEIDIMEAYTGGGPATGWSDANLHPTAYASTIWLDASVLGGTKTMVTTDLSAAFHTYALKWEANKQTFYFDGVEVYTANVTMSDPMYIMLDLWFGSASGLPDSTTPVGIANSFEVNYVRAWKFI
jgi:beta-glucanase (GH16 family)